jgi:hypothetical protein
VLIGGYGGGSHDRLYGGRGADFFVNDRRVSGSSWYPGNSVDVEDFNARQGDKLLLQSGISYSYTEGVSHGRDYITIMESSNAEQSTTLYGCNYGDLLANDSLIGFDAQKFVHRLL